MKWPFLLHLPTRAELIFAISSLKKVIGMIWPWRSEESEPVGSSQATQASLSSVRPLGEQGDPCPDKVSRRAPARRCSYFSFVSPTDDLVPEESKQASAC